MKAAEIQQVTGIQLSTIHRWRRGEIAPTVDRVRKFCAGLGIDPTEALAALGMATRSQPPEPTMDPDVAALLRKLSDPNVNDETKAYIRQTLKVLANLPEPRPARRKKAG